MQTRQFDMRKTLILLALLSTPLAGCMGASPTATCAGAGAVGGAALGSLTDNNLAESALVGGIIGAVAGENGACG
jgi:hypothetical protein